VSAPTLTPLGSDSALTGKCARDPKTSHEILIIFLVVARSVREGVFVSNQVALRRVAPPGLDRSLWSLLHDSLFTLWERNERKSDL
jgi:hypothetical protein